MRRIIAFVLMMVVLCSFVSAQQEKDWSVVKVDEIKECLKNPDCIKDIDWTRITPEAVKGLDRDTLRKLDYEALQNPDLLESLSQAGKLGDVDANQLARALSENTGTTIRIAEGGINKGKITYRKSPPTLISEGNEYPLSTGVLIQSLEVDSQGNIIIKGGNGYKAKIDGMDTVLTGDITINADRTITIINGVIKRCPPNIDSFSKCTIIPLESGTVRFDDRGNVIEIYDMWTDPATGAPKKMPAKFSDWGNFWVDNKHIQVEGDGQCLIQPTRNGFELRGGKRLRVLHPKEGGMGALFIGEQETDVAFTSRGAGATEDTIDILKGRASYLDLTTGDRVRTISGRFTITLDSTGRTASALLRGENSYVSQMDNQGRERRVRVPEANGRVSVKFLYQQQYDTNLPPNQPTLLTENTVVWEQDANGLPTGGMYGWSFTGTDNNIEMYNEYVGGQGNTLLLRQSGAAGGFTSSQQGGRVTLAVFRSIEPGANFARITTASGQGADVDIHNGWFRVNVKHDFNPSDGDRLDLTISNPYGIEGIAQGNSKVELKILDTEYFVRLTNEKGEMSYVDGRILPNSMLMEQEKKREEIEATLGQEPPLPPPPGTPPEGTQLTTAQFTSIVKLDEWVDSNCKRRWTQECEFVHGVLRKYLNGETVGEDEAQLINAKLKYYHIIEEDLNLGESLTVQQRAYLCAGLGIPPQSRQCTVSLIEKGRIPIALRQWVGDPPYPPSGFDYIAREAVKIYEIPPEYRKEITIPEATKYDPDLVNGPVYELTNSRPTLKELYPPIPPIGGRVPQGIIIIRNGRRIEAVWNGFDYVDTDTGNHVPIYKGDIVGPGTTTVLANAPVIVVP